MQKTNAMRLLDAAGIQYTVKEYEVDESDLSAVHAVELLGMPGEQIFKTLVLRGVSGNHFVFCIPAAEELDLKKAARLSGEKKIDLIPIKELQPLTGYVRGGCSPIGMKKTFPTFIEETAELFDYIGISAGIRGCQIFLAPGDFLKFTAAAAADLTVETSKM
ncbi:Cys-tRNA(Pro) deacylase [Leadbettera azotonutricia]|uniref:Cys-tRNA(Pro)/Cys-tRNA(Cys) deacylase n=1 Tax=Leadbettera azotonutricia (strain ATCC BAA-888 / DSM 13862 / ZAS-9) TaxID=545695 RepID=F5Y6X5_LEAAZ|nr:Cys-tRNA(Pro) deacylase [Leadbettera azotonutricia]AEF82222.1 YbaK/ebsC protein [Leadbettera azotonutricia ZAS-9]